jgi:hypothetical protein
MIIDQPVLILANANETATKQENETMLALVHIPTAWQ